MCLRKGHIGRVCRSQSRCSKCSGKHHFTVCSITTRNNSSSDHPTSANTTTQQSASSPSGLNPDAPSFTNPSTTLYLNTSETLLLQTAQTMLYNPNSPQAVTGVRVILDPGSQRSYLTDRVRNVLSLKSIGRRHMSIMTFGSNKRNKQMCDIVRVSMKTREGPDKELELFAVPLICEPLSSQSISVWCGKV